MHARQGLVGETVPAATHAPPMLQPPESVFTQAFVVSLQLSVVQLRESLQSRAVPPQVPAALQVSTAVQNCPSSQDVPAGRAV